MSRTTRTRLATARGSRARDAMDRRYDGPRGSWWPTILFAIAASGLAAGCGSVARGSDAGDVDAGTVDAASVDAPTGDAGDSQCVVGTSQIGSCTL
jgi:hypothetical protein